MAKDFKRVTLKDVAKETGYSVNTVSRALLNQEVLPLKTRLIIQEAAKRLGYTVNINARNMRNKESGAIGILSTWETETFVFPPIIKGVQEFCAENELGVIICTGKETASGNKDYVNYYMQNRISGLILISYVGITNEGIIAELKKYNIPFVCIIGARNLPDVNCVDVNFIESGYMAGKHLVEQGYRKIGYILPGRIDTMSYAEYERMTGCQLGVGDCGLELKLIDTYIDIFDNIYSQEFYDTTMRILNSGEYDALVSLSRQCFSILKTAYNNDIKIPGNMGIISLDNDAFAPYLSPSLTTVDEPLYKIARNAANILCNNLHGDKEVKKIELAPSLTIRESTTAKQK